MIDPASKVALAVDCDGTLIPTDLFHEALLRVLKRRPWIVLAMIGWLLTGKAAFKARIAALAPLDPETVPIRPEVRAMIDAVRAQGRPVVLATAADRSHAETLAAHIGLFDEVLATDAGGNLSSHAKARMLHDRFGEDGFDYIGDSHADLPVWAGARRAYIVTGRGSVLRRTRRRRMEVETIAPLEPAPGTLRAVLKALRPHQWLKNLLVFVPPAAGHQFGLPVLAQAMGAFVAFSLCASSVYILNDLMDIDADRRHHRKRSRPFAAATLKVMHGAALVPLLLGVSLVIAAFVGPLFLGVLVLYAIITTAYSFRLKQQVVLDVILLALLYTMRIVGGSAATHVEPSFWLLACSMFLFFSLAIVKRYSELLPFMGRTDLLAGRGYRPSDMPVLLATGVASGMNAVLVLAFYVDNPATRLLYPSSRVILLVPALILYWIGRLWMKAHRGEVHDDPIVFAARDWQTLVIVAAIGLLFVLAGSPLFA